MRSLLEWFNFPECTEEIAVLSLLQRVAKHQRAALQLADLGAEVRSLSRALTAIYALGSTALTF